MTPCKNSLTFTFATLAIAAALLVARPGNASATDTIDPATHPHLKSWSNIIPAGKRFVVLADFNNEAVLDRETGLVWEKAPSTGIYPWSIEGGTAALFCADKIVGVRKGWRLPSIVELTSLIDPSIALPGPALPLGHPFTNIQAASYYWSATTVAAFPDRAWLVNFSGGVNHDGKRGSAYVWCVRGPMNADTY